MSTGKKGQPQTHKLGAKFGYGYEQLDNGDIKLAPALSNGINGLLARELSIKSLINHIMEYSVKEMESVIKGKEQFWEDVTEECRLDRSKYIYTYNNGIITRKSLDTEDRHE